MTAALGGAGLRDLMVHVRASPVALTVYGIASVMGAFIALDPSAGQFGVVTLIATGATLMALLVVVAGSAAIRRARRGRAPGVWLLLIAVVAGAARAAVLLFLADMTDAGPVDGAPSIVLSSCFSAVVWLGLGGLFAAGHDRYRAHYRALLVGQRRLPVGREADWDRHPDVTRMKSSISGAVQGVGASPSPGDLARASAAIRAEIEQTLRPLSHRLWFGASDEEPHVRWSQVIRDAIRGCTVPVGEMTLLWLAGSVVGGIPLLGAVRGLLAAVISTLLLLAGLIVIPRIVRARPGMARGVVAMSVMSVIPVLGTDAILRVAGVPSSLTWTSGLAPLLVLALAGMLVLTSANALAWADRRTVLEVAARQPDPNAMGYVETVRVSEYLHNTLQSELTGLAMQLDAAAAQADSAQGRQVLERVQAVLNRSISDELASAAERPHDRAARLAAAWAGICAVEVSIDPRIDRGQPLVDAISAAEELIANAVRHSGATEVQLAIDPDPQGLAVVCRTNTSGAISAGDGLGLHLLERVAPGGVEVMDGEEGAVYRLVVLSSHASRRA